MLGKSRKLYGVPNRRTKPGKGLALRKNYNLEAWKKNCRKNVGIKLDKGEREGKALVAESLKNNFIIFLRLP